MTALIIVLSIVVGLMLLYALFRMVMAAVRRRLMRRIAAKFDPDEIIMATLTCNFIGRESLGAAQLRGNGALILTRDALWFLMAARPRELRIPLPTIRNLSFVKSHCGKSLLVDLLRVDYEAEGVKDAAAWWVRDPRKWKRAIEMHLSGS